jgi:hypothetical protein
VDGATNRIENSSAAPSGMASSVEDKPVSSTNPSKAWAIAKGSLKTALSIAVKLVPEPFKGPAEALMKVVDVIEVCLTSILTLHKLLNIVT